MTYYLKITCKELKYKTSKIWCRRDTILYYKACILSVNTFRSHTFYLLLKKTLRKSLAEHQCLIFPMLRFRLLLSEVQLLGVWKEYEIFYCLLLEDGGHRISTWPMSSHRTKGAPALSDVQGWFCFSFSFNKARAKSESILSHIFLITALSVLGILIKQNVLVSSANCIHCVW